MAQIDPSIVLGVKPIQIEDPINRFARQQELSVNMMKANEMQRGLADQNALRQLVKEGLDPSTPEFAKRAYQVSPDLGIKIAKSQADLNKAKFEGVKLEAEAVDSKLKQSRSLLEGISTPEQYMAWHEANHRDPVLGPLLASRGITADQSRARIVDALNRPGGLEKLINESKLGVAKFAEMNTLSEFQKQDLDVKRRGQDMQRIPVGYRMTKEGALEAIPGGPTTTTLTAKEMQQREAKYPQATLAVKSFEAKTNELEKDLIALRNHPGLASITGIVAGRAPGITKEGRAAQALYDKILARGGFKELQDMRAASPTGGALGNVSNQEGTQLRQSFAAIDRVQNAEDIQKAIDTAITDLQGSKSRVREAYDMTYDYKAPAASGGAAPNAPAGGADNDPLGLRKR